MNEIILNEKGEKYIREQLSEIDIEIGDQFWDFVTDFMIDLEQLTLMADIEDIQITLTIGDFVTDFYKTIITT